MSTEYVGTWNLAEALQKEGFPLPENCGTVTLTLGVGDALMLQYNVFLTPENLQKLGRAFQAMANQHLEEQKRRLENAGARFNPDGQFGGER